MKYCFIKELGFKIEKVEQFKSGEKVDLKDSTLDKKEIDIVGLDVKNEPRALFEIKVNIFEKIQDSQKQNSNYQNYAKSKGIPIYYIVPKDYSNRNEIGYEDDIIKIITWNSILDKTPDYDPIYSEAIENNVENVKCVSYKNKAFMARVWEVLCRMHLKIDFTKENVMGNYSENDDFGNWVYTETEKDFGIGFYSEGVFLWHETTDKNLDKYKTIGFEPDNESPGFVYKKIMDIDKFKTDDIKEVSDKLK